MVKPLELELRTYDRERGRLEDAHRGKFVLIRGEEVAGIFDDFQTASKHAAQRFKRESYLIHCIATEMMHIPSGLLDGLAAMYTHARGCEQQRSVSPMNAHRPDRLDRTGKRVLAEAALEHSRRRDGLAVHGEATHIGEIPSSVAPRRSPAVTTLLGLWTRPADGPA